jgi:hypothetical protein
MRKHLAALIFVCGPVFSATAQQSAPGLFFSKVDSATVEGIVYRKDDRFLPSEKKDSVTIRKIVKRMVFYEVGTFVLSKGNNYYPIDSTARMFIARGYRPLDEVLVTMRRKPLKLQLNNTKQITRVKSSVGYVITPGQKVRFGKGTNADSSFRFVRYHSTSVFRLYTEETNRQAINSFNPGDRGLAGQEMVVDHIAFCKGRRKAPAEYWLVNFPDRRVFQIEIELEPAIQSGELQVPEEFKKSE